MLYNYITIHGAVNIKKALFMLLGILCLKYCSCFSSCVYFTYLYLLSSSCSPYLNNSCMYFPRHATGMSPTHHWELTSAHKSRRL